MLNALAATAFNHVDANVNHVGMSGAVGIQHTDWRAAAASALDWWAEAGVDLLVDAAPRNWLAPAPPPAPADPAALPAAIADMPDDWPAFAAWRAGPHAPEAGLRGVAIAAAGPADAPLMVLTDCPDRDDEPAGVLLSGAAGRLFDRMLAAIGLTRDQVHIAAVCHRRPVAGRLPAELADALHDCARHHVGLVAPQRLLLIGNAASRAILATDTAHARGHLHQFAHKGGSVVAVATHHPRLLLEQPARKADSWKDLQLLVKDWMR